MAKSILYFKIIAVLVFSAFFYSCKKTQKTYETVSVEELIKGLDKLKLSKLILFKSNDKQYKPPGVKYFAHCDTLDFFYRINDGQPIWLSYLKDSAFKTNLIKILGSAVEHGLKDEFYNKKLIEKYLLKFDSLNEIKTNEDYNFLSDLDYTISLSVLTLFNDLALGHINPYKFYKPFYTLVSPKTTNFNLFSVLNHPTSFADTIAVKAPCTVRYRTLQLIYKYYLDYLSKNKIKDYDTSQKSNSEHNLAVIDQRLDLLWNSINKVNKKPLENIAESRDRFVSKTRMMYGLPDGKIDSLFVAKFVKKSDEIIDDILANLEQERWFSIPDTGKFILIRMTQFLAEIHTDSIRQMKVCIGKNKPDDYDERYKQYIKTKNYLQKPINTETPIIQGELSEIIINPTWTVPNSIIGKEMFSKIVKNPDYLTQKGYEVLLNGKVISPRSVNWHKFSPYNVPVKIRQKAGNANSLGILKFNFPNNFNIYMHDTPEKNKFNQANRAVSHGCIRLHKPTTMAELMLNLQEDTTLTDKVRLKLGLQPYDSSLRIEDSLLKPIKNTEYIRLKTKIKVYLYYRTINVERNGKITFNYDIYRRNKAIAKKLK
ncbi:MAG: L,D-transpeptidase family protein [Bacteroidetes bacterium]|nr:L,D-transpeptidase family protein [Bacteroidota bacterium]